MSQTDKLKLDRWKQVSKNPEFEDPTDPFHPHKRRYKIELNRYLSNVNLNYMPPMPRPVNKNSSQTKFNSEREHTIKNNMFRENYQNNLAYNQNRISLNQLNMTQSSDFN